MSRHSKWSKVKQFKGAIDAKRSASFTKLAREITVATREKGDDPAFNVRLRVAIDRAKKGLMPKENIERAIKRGTGELASEGQIEELLYEAYGPGGSAILIDCLTDNRNRSVAEVKLALSKHGGRFADAGSVSHLFKKVGVIRLSALIPEPSREEKEFVLIDGGAIDIFHEEATEIHTEQHQLACVTDLASRLDLDIVSAEMEWIPLHAIEVTEEDGNAIDMLIDALDELDDVSHVYTNLS